MHLSFWRPSLVGRGAAKRLVASVAVLALVVAMLTTSLLFARPTAAATKQQHSTRVSLQAQSGTPPRLEIFSIFEGEINHQWSDDSGATWVIGPSLPRLGDHQLFVGTPAAVSDGIGRLTVFARSELGFLYSSTYRSGSWSGWTLVPGTSGAGVFITHDVIFADNYLFTSDPAVSSWGPGRLDLFLYGRHEDTGAIALLHTWADQGAWSGRWEVLGTGLMQGKPAAVSWGPGRVDVFVRGGGNELDHKWFDQGSWSSGWENKGGTLASSPAVASWQPGHLVVFAWDQAGRLSDIGFWGQWFGWGTVDDSNAYHFGDPAATTAGLGTWQIVVARGQNDTLLHKGYNDGWVPGWGSLGAATTWAPAATAWVPTGIVVPNVLYDDRASATDAITAAGLTVGTVTPDNQCLADAGTVIMQDPIGGARVLPGSAVNLWVSSGLDSAHRPCVFR